MLVKVEYVLQTWISRAENNVATDPTQAQAMNERRHFGPFLSVN
jgi:hypothetical protein